MILDTIKFYFKKALIPTIVITLIFFLNYYFFGINNTIIGPFATLSFLRFRNMKDHYSCMTKTFIIYVLMSVFSYFALMNLTLIIICNIVALFWICYFLIDEYNPNNYFPAGMALIFFQIFPANSFHDLVIRWEALLGSFLIIFIFIFILSYSKKDNPLKVLVKEGLELSKDIVKHIELGDTQIIYEKQLVLCEINKKISSHIYIANRSSLRKNVYANRYCSYIALFQIVNYTSNEYLTASTEKDSVEDSTIIDNLDVVKNMLRNFECAFDEDIPLTDTHKLNFRDLKMDIRSFRLRFSLRIVLTITPCLVYAYLSPHSNAYWLAISVFFMMIPIYENTFKRVTDRTFGTLIGILICMILFTIFKSESDRIIIMTIANFCIYSANSYLTTVAYITCSALALNDLSASTIPMLEQRLLYTLAGAAITIVVNRFVFPIKASSSISYIKELLDTMRTKIYSLHTIERNEKNHQLNKLIVKSYLLSNRLDEFAVATENADESLNINVYQKMHMLSIANWLIKGRH